MKKIFLIVLLSSLMVSCGKKNDPVYKEQRAELLKIEILVNS